MRNIIENLSKLHGSWKGIGTGKFPTIDSFKYEEHLRFEVNLAYPLIHYEQKTILLPTQEASHWESGFIRVIDDDVIEMSNSQDSGRVEILQGEMSKVSDAGFELKLVSITLAHDSRLISTERIFKMIDNTLECYQSMATNTTDEPTLLPHLHSKLTKLG